DVFIHSALFRGLGKDGASIKGKSRLFGDRFEDLERRAWKRFAICPAGHIEEPQPLITENERREHDGGRRPWTGKMRVVIANADGLAVLPHFADESRAGMNIVPAKKGFEEIGRLLGLGRNIKNDGLFAGSEAA